MINDAFGVSAAELFIADVKSKGDIAPLDDGRFTLNWELAESGKE